MNKVFLFSFLFIILGCSSDNRNNNPDALSREDFYAQIKSTNNNIIFIWASWCVASKEVMNEVILPLSDSLTNGNHDAQIIALCSSQEQDSIVYGIRKENLMSYYIENPGNGTGFNDRKMIKKYLKLIFDDKQMNILTESKLGFSIPIMILVNSNGEIMQHSLNHSVSDIIRQIKNKQ